MGIDGLLQTREDNTMIDTERQERILRIKSDLADLEKNKSHWEEQIRVNPQNQLAKEQLPVVTRKIKETQSYLKLQIEDAELAANPDSPQAKAELKELEKINKDGTVLMNDITKAAIALDGQIQELMTLQKQADRLAKRYDKRPWYSGVTMARIQTMGHAITRWRQEMQSRERHNEIMGKKARAQK